MDLQIFNYEQKQIRTVVDRNGETLFVAKDVCDALGLSNTSQALGRIELEDKDNIILDDVTGRNRKMLAVTESGLYALIFESQKAEAKKFKKWVTGDVLPKIRKTGSYVAQNVVPFEVLERETSAALRLASTFGFEGNQAKLSAAKAMKEYYKIDVQSLIGATHLVSESQEAELTPTELGKRVGLSAQAINKLLAEKGLQEKTEDKWIATNKGKRFAIVLDTGKKHSNGAPVQQIKWKESVTKEIAA